VATRLGLFLSIARVQTKCKIFGRILATLNGLFFSFIIHMCIQGLGHLNGFLRVLFLEPRGVNQQMPSRIFLKGETWVGCGWYISVIPAAHEVESGRSQYKGS
jgi:hypothetical protein